MCVSMKTIMKTMCLSAYHYYGFVETHTVDVCVYI